MGQADVLKYLKKTKGKFTTREIAEALKISNIGASMKRLRKHKEVNFKKVMRKKGGVAYIYWGKK